MPAKKAKPKKPKKLVLPKLVQVRTSERSQFERCKWAWNLSYNEHLKPINEAPALKFGTLVHEALELRYPPGKKRGPLPAESFERIFDEHEAKAERMPGFRDAEDEWIDAKELGINMLEGYVEEYGEDDEWEVIASEMTFQVLVCDPRTGKPLFIYVGTMDGVWRNLRSKKIRVNDYKTTKGDPTKEGANKYTLDEQATSYWTWGCDWLLEKKILKPRELEDLDGMLYTFLRKAMKDERPQNADGLYLNQPTKGALMAHYANIDREPPARGSGSGTNGNVVVADLLADLGSEALLLGEVSDRQGVPRFFRDIVYRSDTERENARLRAVQQFYEMERFRSGDAYPYKSPGTGFPDEQCKGCGFRDICELHESGDDWEGVRDVTMTTWNPYSAHEVQEEGKGK